MRDREEEARAIERQTQQYRIQINPLKNYSHLDRKVKEFSIQNPIIYIKSRIKVPQAQGPQPSARK